MRNFHKKQMQKIHGKEIQKFLDKNSRHPNSLNQTFIKVKEEKLLIMLQGVPINMGIQ